MKTLTIHRPAHPAEGDFCGAIEGELAIAPPLVCDKADCGCDRALVGLNSMHSSTTVKVSDLDLTMAEMVTACEGFLYEAGWTGGMDDDSPEHVHQLAHRYMDLMVRVAAEFDTGEVLRPQYHREAECWDFRPVDANGGAK